MPTTPTPHDHIRDALRYLSQSLGALLHGNSGDAHQFLDLADREIEAIDMTPPAGLPPLPNPDEID